MADLFCPTHPQTKLLCALKGGAGYCVTCSRYVQAAGVPEPKREAPKVTSKPRKVKAKAKRKARASAR